MEKNSCNESDSGKPKVQEHRAASILPNKSHGCGNADIPFLRESDETYMQMAIDEANIAAAMGEVPIGAVVVYQPYNKGTRKPITDAKVIARGHNLRETLRDPAAHAEFLAMKAASEFLEAWRLTDCTVYVTLEPCIMCAGLMHQARINRCVYGASDKKAGALGTLYSIHSDARLNHTFEVTNGVLADECTKLLKDFFTKRRKSNKH